MNDGRVKALGVRYYGELAAGRTEMIANAVLVGMFQPMLEMGVTPVNARNVAHERGIEIIESKSTRGRNYTSLLSVKLHNPEGERWVEGAVFERTSPRLVLLDGIAVEAPLEGTMIVIRNTDQPGVIGDIGTILGKHRVNIANFALGRQGDCRLVRISSPAGREAAGAGVPGAAGADRGAVHRVPVRGAGGADVPDRGPGPVDGRG